KTTSGTEVIRIPARYKSRSEKEPLPTLSKMRYADEDFYLFHGLDPATGQPDWLGEIFEWLSCGHEKYVSQRDSVGRLPDSELIFKRIGLQPWKPQAALQMAWLEHVSRNEADGEALPKAPSPITEAEHLVVCSHDVDFYFINRRSAFLRLFKNLGISLLIYKSWAYFYSNSAMILRLLAGERVGDFLPSLFEHMEQHGSHSTLFIVPAHGHRRDPDYALAELAPQIK